MNLPFKKFTREKRNVSSIKEVQWKHAQLEQNKSINLPLQDYLTELPNRISFQLEMKKLIQIGKPFSVVILDLDRFKHINMNLGQRIADKFLQNVSQYMIDYLSEDYRLARIGGDKFGIFLQKMQAEDEVKAFVSNLIRYLNTSFIIDKQEIHLTASAGISSYPEHGKTADTLLKSAELALSQAKKIGRKKFVLFSPDIENQFTKQYYIERDLRDALEENQFELLFQPRVEAKTGKIVKAEALLRWNHPILGPLTPEEFIPLAEEIGLIYRMTNWVMNEVAQFIEQVKETEVPIVPISVNISSNYFLQKDWKEHLNTLLDKTHIHPSLIEFEITESTRIHHEEKMKSDLEFLREKGFSIALDDFGKGFSSISHIQKFPIQTIKIDQSFTEDVVTSQKTNRLVKSLIVLAKNLNLDIVAEGVETKEQLDFFIQQECKEIQGYIFSKPVPADAFLSLLQKGSLAATLTASNPIQENRRKYFRVSFANGFEGNMELIKVQQKEVRLGHCNIVIENIGAGGIRILSHLDLPVRSDVIYRFKTVIDGQPLQVNGIITWKKDIRGFFQYGIEFLITETEQDNLIKLLNQMQLQINQNKALTKTNQLQVDKYTYLKSLK